MKIEQKRSLIRKHDKISLARQCELLGLNRTTRYYQAKEVSKENIKIMHILDEQYTRTPFYGVLRMMHYLRSLGHQVNEKRVRRLLRLMGIEAIYPKKDLSKATQGHKIYPYLLRDIEIKRINQVWSTDITYIRMKHGFVYLAAIIDWYSRYVLDWELSINLEADFCIEVLSRVLAKGHCEIFNVDQGSQFTSHDFTTLLLTQAIKISMDGRGRALDNIFIERLWRSLKYELIYLREFKTVKEVKEAIREYFIFYNNERLHQSLGYKTPASIYVGEGICGQSADKIDG